MKRLSIRLRLLLAYGVAVALALVLAAWGLAVMFDRHAERVAAGDLRDRLEHLASAVEPGLDGLPALPEPPRDPLYLRPYSGHYWQIESPGGELRSRSLWDAALPLPDASGDEWQGEISGPEDERLLALVQRIVVVTPNGDVPLRIAVAIDRVELDQARAGFLSDLAPYLTLLALALVGAGATAGAVGLRPLSAIGRRVAALAAGQAQRIGSDVPPEVLPLAAEIDALLNAREAEVEQARLRAGDLAHGFKTPLQALLGEAARLRVGGAYGAAAGIEEIVCTMRSHVDRELARARLAVGPPTGRSDPVAVACSVVAVLRRTPGSAALDFDVTGPPDLAVRLDRADLAEALGALAENAARHARARVGIACTREGDRVAIRVRDDGPGAETAVLDRLTRRGVRLDEHEDGSGLGLAIAAGIAAAASGTLSLHNLAPGFEAELTLPT